MNNLVVISGVTVSILVVILLFKLNKTKIEYDNKLLVLNRKVRDLTNLVDLNNTKTNLINNEANNQEPINSVNNSEPVNPQQNSGIDTQYHNFVQNNGNFFDNLDNFDAPLSEDIKNDIDKLVNQEIVSDQTVNSEESVPPVSNYEEELVQNTNQEELLNNIVLGNVQSFEGLNYEGSVTNNLINVNLSNGEVDTNLEAEVDTNLEAEVDTNLEVEADTNLEVEVDTNLEVDTNVELNETVLEENAELDTVEIDVNVENNTNLEVEVLDDNRELESNVNTSVNFNDLENMSVKSLQDICREYKLKIKGRKDELIDRIKEYLSVDKL